MAKSIRMRLDMALVYRNNGKENGNRLYDKDYSIGIIFGVMEKKMETTIRGLGLRVI